MQDAIQIERPGMVLYPSRSRLIWSLLLCLAFVAIGILMAAAGEVAGWLCIVFFGLGTIAFCVQLLPGASYLRISPEGFIFSALFRKSPFISWREVGFFRVAQVPPSGRKMIVFDWETRAERRIAKINRALVGAGSALPDTYGMKAEELAELMNEWRSRATGSPAEPARS